MFDTTRCRQREAMATITLFTATLPSTRAHANDANASAHDIGARRCRAKEERARRE